MGMVQFCSGTMLWFAMAFPIEAFGMTALQIQLLFTAGTSFIYQGIDIGLDSIFGDDFYDEDSNMFFTMVFDVALAGIGSTITKSLSMTVKGLSNNMQHLTKIQTRWLAQFFNKLPFGPKFNLKNANVNINKHILREMFKSFAYKIDNSKLLKWLVIENLELPGNILSDTNENPFLKMVQDFVMELVKDDDTYDESYNEYSVIDYDEKGNLIIIDIFESANKCYIEEWGILYGNRRKKIKRIK